MEWTITYILSQIFTVLMYIFLASTYYLKDRKMILIIGYIASLSIVIAYALQSAWTGFAMGIVAILRNINFLADEKKNGKKTVNTIDDYFKLGILYLISIIFAIFSYNGILSLLSVAATMLYTYSVWQTKTLIYKKCGIFVSILWIAYNIYIMSLFGIILESILLIFSTTGYILAQKKEKMLLK